LLDYYDPLLPCAKPAPKSVAARHFIDIKGLQNNSRHVTCLIFVAWLQHDQSEHLSICTLATLWLHSPALIIGDCTTVRLSTAYLFHRTAGTDRDGHWFACPRRVVPLRFTRGCKCLTFWSGERRETKNVPTISSTLAATTPTGPSEISHSSGMLYLIEIPFPVSSKFERAIDLAAAAPFLLRLFLARRRGRSPPPPPLRV
jgi:hypothetical protein